MQALDAALPFALFLLSLMTTINFAPSLRASQSGAVLAGLLSGLAFFFLAVALGTVYGRINWPISGIALVFALSLASHIAPVSVVTGFLFSAAALIYTKAAASARDRALRRRART